MEKWIKCRKCEHEYSSKLSRCPNCSCVTVNFNLIISVIVCLMVAVAAVIAVVSAFGDKSAIKTAESDISSVIESSSAVTALVSEDQESSYSSKFSASSNKNGTTSSSKASQKASSVSTVSSYEEKLQSQVSSSASSNKYKIGTELFGDNYYITVPLNFLRAVYDNFGLESEGIKFDEFAYSLSDEDKAAGFTLAIKNADGSATKMISYNKYGKFITDYAVETMKFVIETKRLDFIDDIDHSNDFDAFGVVVNKNKKDLTPSEYAQILMLGIVGTEKQYYSVNSNNTCTIEIVYSDKEKEILKFPEALF